MQEKFGSVKPDGHTAYLRRVEKLSALKQKRAVDATSDAASAAAGGAAAARLGNLTESRAAFREFVDEKTGEIQRFRLDSVRREYVLDTDPLVAAATSRKARFGAQRTAADLLGQSKTPRDTVWRVVGCARRRVGEDVSVLHSASVGKAHFGGLMICGSVWTCPPCAAKVSERRKQEIKRATDLHMECGGAMYMITHTFAHQRNDDLEQLLPKLSKARQHMRAQRAYKDLRRDLGFVGDIRTLEVTYGDANGFHPHEHDLWLVADKLTRVQLRHMKAVLFTLWERACRVAGLGAPNRKRGVNVIEAESAAEYMAKFGHEPRWGVASELTKQHVKSGRAASMTPFDLLRAAHDGEGRFGPLFVKFARAFFGKRQVVWSRGLKQLFGLEELSDEEVAAIEAEDATVVIRITPAEWRAVLKRPFDERSALLDMAEGAGGESAIRRYLDAIVDPGPVQTYGVEQPVDLVAPSASPVIPVPRSSPVGPAWTVALATAKRKARYLMESRSEREDIAKSFVPRPSRLARRA